ncbi:MAG: NAD(P)H-dependent oxidoreductase subunit E [Anaerolineales bacterium]|nr:NAD(P)H-dependent oxidoreductase subunit E [Anaerolineales bacterium]
MKKATNTLRPIDAAISGIANRHHNDPAAVLEVLKDVQAAQGGISKEAIGDVARSLKMPAHQVYGVASFYSMLSLAPQKGGVIRVCDGPVCWLKNGSALMQALLSATSGKSGWRVERTSCLGLCDHAPAALVNDQQAGPISAENAPKLLDGWRQKPATYPEARPGEVRVMLANAGKIDPDALESALKAGAYRGLKAALGKTPEEVIAVVEASGLAGRGGAGFPVGRKWRFVFQARRTPKYIICNADESEPLIFKDRVLIDTNPQQLLEGMAIAGYATGANHGYIYIRGEYPRQAERLERAIQQAEAAGWLGENIQGSGFSFHIHVHSGAGAYICGEETALIESLEGKRGEPRVRPPYPPSYGYQGDPTVVNNVESYSAAPAILVNGSDWYKSLGAGKDGAATTTPGTKLYMILGHVKNPGCFEAPFGLTLRQAIEQFGGGMLPGSEFHFALTGGAAGTIIPEALLDIPVDYASVRSGVSLGAGAFLVCDQSISVVAFLRELLHFFASESCGKCTPCRVGTYRAREILSNLVAGTGKKQNLQELQQLSDVMLNSSFCGLGQAVPIPMNSALTNFAEEFENATA